MQHRSGIIWQLVVALLLLGWIASSAQAEFVEEEYPGTLDNVFLVISNQGSFGSAYGGGEYYPQGELAFSISSSFGLPGFVTVINFSSWVGGVYPQALSMDVHGPTLDALRAVLGSEFEMSDFVEHEAFLIGSVFDGIETHLVLSATPETPPPFLDDMFEQNLINGVTMLDLLDPNLGMDAGVSTMSADSFFGFFADYESWLPEDIFGIVDPFNGDYVDWNTTITIGAVGTESDGVLFGFTDGVFLGTQGITFSETGIVGTFTPPVPEPATLCLLLGGALGVGLARRRRRVPA